MRLAREAYNVIKAAEAGRTGNPEDYRDHCVPRPGYLVEPLGQRVNRPAFTSSGACVAAVVRLIEDKALRIEQMLNNYRYYHAWLRPDSLVLNTLAVALSDGMAPAANPARSPWR